MTEQENRRLAFTPLDASSAYAIAGWAYDPPYDLYNFRREECEGNIRYLSDPANGIYGIRTGSGERIGFCSFGMDAQVPGGSYDAAALDIGLGIRPDLTGAGSGTGIIGDVLAFAEREYQPARFRVTIASLLRMIFPWRTNSPKRNDLVKADGGPPIDSRMGSHATEKFSLRNYRMGSGCGGSP